MRTDQLPFNLDGTKSAAEIHAYESSPIPIVLCTIAVNAVELGLKGRRIDFSHRPYHLRSPEARGDYDLLRESIKQQGVRDRVIVHAGHVLVGMRRVEIARELGIEHLPAAEILEDVTGWWKHDTKRLERLRLALGSTTYGSPS